MSKPLVLDLETKHTFREFADPKKLGITVVGVFDYQTEQSLSFTEDELSKLFPLLEQASFLIGFNIVSFDLPVLQAYYPGSVVDFPVFDILDDIKEKLGRRLALNDLVGATLGKKKSGHGLAAIELFKEGKIEELKKYCLDDVLLTKELFDYGVSHGEVFYPSHIGKAAITVNWKKNLQATTKKDVSLTLPF